MRMIQTTIVAILAANAIACSQKQPTRDDYRDAVVDAVIARYGRVALWDGNGDGKVDCVSSYASNHNRGLIRDGQAEYCRVHLANPEMISDRLGSHLDQILVHGKDAMYVSAQEVWLKSHPITEQKMR